MTANQYRAALDKLGIPVIGVVDLFGVSKRQAQRFASGEAPVPKLVAVVVKLLVNGKIGMEDLR
jgi:hypothetical protein